jgi:hypothetical protein
VSYPGLEKVKTLRSFRSSQSKVKPSQRIHKTVDYLTTPGWVMLVHEDPEVVKADAALVHHLEETRQMYELAPSSP